MTELSSKIDVERELHAKHIRGSACESFQMLLRGFEMTVISQNAKLIYPIRIRACRHRRRASLLGVCRCHGWRVFGNAILIVRNIGRLIVGTFVANGTLGRCRRDRRPHRVCVRPSRSSDYVVAVAATKSRLLVCSMFDGGFVPVANAQNTHTGIHSFHYNPDRFFFCFWLGRWTTHNYPETLQHRSTTHPHTLFAATTTKYTRR